MMSVAEITRRATRPPKRGWVMVLAPKGGMGKTTTTANLVVCAARAGKKALAVDFDAQKSLTDWGRLRGRRKDREDLLKFSIYEGDLTQRDAAYAVADEHQFVIFDTPPGAEGDTGGKLQSLARRCDFVVIPCSMSVSDIKKVRDFGPVLAADNIPYAFYFPRVSRVHVTKTDTEACARALKGYGDVLDIAAPESAEIRRMMDVGICSSDDPSLPGHAVFAALWAHVAGKVFS